jgi:hypothetical protein
MLSQKLWEQYYAMQMMKCESSDIRLDVAEGKWFYLQEHDKNDS